MAVLSAPRLYFENPVGRLLEHPAGYLLVEYHPGTRKMPELQAFLNHAVNLVQLRGLTKMLSDQRRMTLFTETESRWVLDHWLDVSERQGIKLQGAVLLPQDVFARLSVGNLINEAQSAAPMAYRMFDDQDAAVAWLLAPINPTTAGAASGR
jgi:hypothetical protein